MNQQEALNRLATIIETDYEHEYKKQNTELYKKYLVLSTGKGWEGFLHRLTSRVSEEEFTEIVNVTIDLCKSVVKNLCHVFYRVTRSIGIKIDWRVEDGSKKESFEDILSTFGRYGFEGYMDKRFTDFCKIDPNGFLVVEFKEVDGKDYARPYPIEYYSPNIVDYRYDLNQLVYLAVEQEVERSNGTSKVEVEDYTIYTKDGAVKFIARPDLKNAPAYDPKRKYVSGELIGLKEREEKNATGNMETVYDVYELLIPLPYNLEWVPAVSVGYLTDEYTRGETFLNFFDNAVPLLEKIIKANSESDISMAKHAFPQKIQFTPPCPNNCEPNEHGTYCVDSEVCPTCHGAGHMGIHRSGIDYIYIPMTDATKDIKLDNIVNYVALPLDTIKWQWEHIINDLVSFAKRVMYNTEIFDKQEVSDTATSKLIEMENMYDTLFIYAVHFASVKSFILKTIGAITSIPIEVKANVSKDFKLLGKAQLLEMLKLASDAGANSAVIEAINDELAYAFFGNSPAYNNYLQRKKLLPFQNKTKEQVMLIINSLPTTHKLRMMFSFGEEVISLLESENEGWAEFTMEKKQELIDAKLAEIEAEMNAEKETVTPPTLNA